MLFLTDHGYLNVVSEPQFKNVFTLQTNDKSALDKFEPLTPASVMVDAKNLMYPYVLHVRNEVVAEVLDCPLLLFAVDKPSHPVSMRAPHYLLEGYDREFANQVQIYARADEMPGLAATLENIDNLGIFPVYKVPSGKIAEGGNL